MDTEQSHNVRDIIAADLYRYGHSVSVRALVRNYVLNPGFKYTFWMRLAFHFSNEMVALRPVYYLCRGMLHRCRIKYGISVPYNTRIGPGLYIGHHGGIVVSHEVIIGRDCNINHSVTLGVAYGGKNPGAPVIGDRVYLGPGCKVVGGIRLGNDAAVGANAVVVESVPDCGVAVGVPAKVKSLKGSSAYVGNTAPDLRVRLGERTGNG